MTKPPWAQRPIWHGISIGVALPVLVLSVLAAFGRLMPFLDHSRAYALLPFLAPLGLASFFIAWGLYPHYRVARAGMAFALGALIGGSLAATMLLWLSAPERPAGNRIVFSLFGGPMLLGFWLWIGAILGYATKQQRSSRARPPPP